MVEMQYACKLVIKFNKIMYCQTCIKRSPFGQRKYGLIRLLVGDSLRPYKTVDLLKEVQCIWNFLWQDTEKVTF